MKNSRGSPHGSSPRLRGALGMWRSEIQTLRLIPASAGSTDWPPMPRRSRSAHPRVCGEHEAREIARRVFGGSSPRLRGARLSWRCQKDRFGLIPASAGSTGGSMSPAGGLGAHPRVCGEHHERIHSGSLDGGSSPRLRGARDTLDLHRHTVRLIPASAGSTRECFSAWFPAGAHPRVCGEHGGHPQFHPHKHGSSPRLRGARADQYV